MVKNVHGYCRRVIDLCAQAGKGSARKLGEALAVLGGLTDERTAKWESLLLPGDPATIAAARTWRRRVWHVELVARGERGDADELDALHEQVIEDRTRFYIAARRDLGISSGGVPPGSEVMASSYGLLDLAIGDGGRQEFWEDSPGGWPQRQRWGSKVASSGWTAAWPPGGRGSGPDATPTSTAPGEQSEQHSH